jgi:hypothetical protein
MGRSVFVALAVALIIYAISRLFAGLRYLRSEDGADRNKMWRPFGEFIVIICFCLFVIPHC